MKLLTSGRREGGATVQRSIAIISVPMIAIWLIIGVLAATAMYAVSVVLDDKPAYAKGKCAAPAEGAASPIVCPPA